MGGPWALARKWMNLVWMACSNFTENFVFSASVEKNQRICQYWAYVLTWQTWPELRGSWPIWLQHACARSPQSPLAWLSPVLGNQVHSLVICTFPALLSGCTTCLLDDFTRNKGMSREEWCVAQGRPMTWWQSQDQNASVTLMGSMVTGDSFLCKGFFLSFLFSIGKRGISSSS